MSVTLPKKENAMENNGMITLTKAEMLEEWKKRKGFYSGVRSCDVEREDGVDLDGVLQREMDDWYNKMLAPRGPVGDAPDRKHRKGLPCNGRCPPSRHSGFASQVCAGACVEARLLGSRRDAVCRSRQR